MRSLFHSSSQENAQLQALNRFLDRVRFPIKKFALDSGAVLGFFYQQFHRGQTQSSCFLATDSMLRLWRFGKCREGALFNRLEPGFRNKADGGGHPGRKAGLASG